MSYVSKISKKLEENGYCSNAEINCALEMAECLQKPLLIEGVPGVGKTALPVAIAKAKGVYKGRKPITHPDFEKVVKIWRKGEITAVEAMRRLEMKSSTFYNKVKEYEKKNR